MRTLTKITVLAVILMIAMPFSAYAVDGKIMIAQTASTTFPIVINQPGSYILTSNLTVDTNVQCIDIDSDDVTLDLNGFTITGSGDGILGYGIGAYGSDNITIMNGNVREFVGVGIQCFGFGVHIKDIQAINNGDGFDITGNGYVTNCTAIGNTYDGFNVSASIVTNCVAKSNGEAGFRISNVNLTNCRAHTNKYGIFGGGNNRIVGNAIMENTEYGIRINGSQYNYIIKNSASGNPSGNFVETGGASNNYMPLTGDNGNYGW